MGISIGNQAMTLVGALWLGFGVGIFYDVFRILRVRLGRPALAAVLDGLFWPVVTLCVFLYAMAAGEGELRLYMVVAIFGGGTLYFLLLSRFALWLGYRIADIIGFFFYICTRPIVWVWIILRKWEKSLKNLFHYWRKRYKIRGQFGKSATGKREFQRGRKGSGRIENKTGRHTH